MPEGISGIDWKSENETLGIATSDIPKKKKPASNIKLLAITFAAILTLSVVVTLLGSNPTGNVIVDIDKVNLDEMAYSGSQYFLSSTDNQTLPLRSARISGEIIGNGSVKVYLSTKDEKKLVFSNIAEKFVSRITGFAVKEVSNNRQGQGSSLTVDLSDMQLGGNALSNIDLRYDGNELGMFTDSIKVSWLPDNGEKILGIKMNGAEFWGYDTAGSPLGPQSSGTQLSAWGQKISDGSSKSVDEILFDSDMSDKKITIKLTYYDYLIGFRLAPERTMKIFLDLSAKERSYAEEEGGGRQFFQLEKLVLKPKENNPDTAPIEPNNGTSASSGTGTRTSSGSSSGNGQTNNNQNQQGTGNSSTSINQDDINSIPLDTSFNLQKVVSSYPGYEVTPTPDGKRYIRERNLPPSSVQLTDRNISVAVRIVEDPVAKESFEENILNISEEDFEQISSECSETCILDLPEDGEYEFVFEIEEGTAFNVTSISLT